MRVRGLVLMATVLAVAAAPAAATEKKKQPRARVCHLIVDPAGDTAFDAPMSGSAPYDILFADAARGRTELVAALRVVAGPDRAGRAPAGAEWRFGFTSGGVRYEFTAGIDARGMRGSQVTIGDAVERHTFTVAGNVLVWRVKLPRAEQPIAASDASAETRYGPLTVDSATGQRSGERKGCARAK